MDLDEEILQRPTLADGGPHRHFPLAVVRWQ